MSRVRLLDLQREWALFKDEVRAVVDEVLESQYFIGGPAIGELECALAGLTKTESAIAVSNGTDALLVSLMALEVGAGDEVILPSFTFFATAGTVARTGATPVFVDIDAETWNIDPACVERAITDRTKAIIPVHIFGLCADMPQIMEIARSRGIPVLEDAAQAIGASVGGEPACSLGDIAAVSFYPTKNLGGFGEGGMVFTKDEALGQLVRSLRVHGESSRYYHDRVGGNFRLDTMKAAILGVKLKRLAEFNEKRRANAAFYNERFSEVAVQPQRVPDGHESVYHQYSILADDRDGLVAALREQEIDAGIYYPVPLHLQKCFESLGYKRGMLPVCESVCDRVLSLPCHPMLTKEETARVADAVTALVPSATVAKAS